MSLRSSDHRVSTRAAKGKVAITGNVILLASIFLPCGALAQSVGDAKSRANIVVIIADDLGYGETGMMGNAEIPTPNIDSLAADGIRCTAGYVTAPYCSPSRAGIMTGRFQYPFGYDINPTGKRNLLAEAGLPENETTFVQRMADAKYATGLVGKWHLGASPSKHPLKRGFQEFYGFLHEGHFYVPGPPYENVLTMIRDNSLSAGERKRTGDVIRGNYARMSEPAYDADNPMLRGTKEIVENDYLTDAISDEAVEFINKHAADPFLLMVSYNAVHSPMQARDDDLERLRRISDDQRRIFAAMLVAMDRGVGRVRQAIEENSLARRTLIVFVSDNGGPTAELTSSNAPLRGGKGTLYEGGIRVPMVWTMPGQLPAGRVEDRPVLSLDIAATALDLAGIPADPSGDGQSMLDWINDGSRDHPHEDLYWRMPGGRMALRSGNWKIVRPAKNQPIELYHLAGDMGEKRNLAVEYPDRLGQLINKWKSMDTEMADPIVLPPAR
jgi:arylsulfatase A-like enzyme